MKRTTNWAALVTATALVLTIVPTTSAVFGGELAGVEMPDTIEAGEHQLHLNGMAVRKVAIFKVYVAGLYLPKKLSDGQTILEGDTPRRVAMQFLRDVDRESMCDAWYEGLEANVPNPSETVKQQFDQLCEWMPDVKKGDQFVFSYAPGHGTHIGIGGDTKGKLDDKPFADALFSSWIGPKPGPGEAFKKALLGN